MLDVEKEDCRQPPAGHQHVPAEGEGFEPPAQGWFPEQRFSRTPVNLHLTWTDALITKLKVIHESRRPTQDRGASADPVRPTRRPTRHCCDFVQPRRLPEQLTDDEALAIHNLEDTTVPVEPVVGVGAVGFKDPEVDQS